MQRRILPNVFSIARAAATVSWAWMLSPPAVVRCSRAMASTSVSGTTQANTAGYSNTAEVLESVREYYGEGKAGGAWDEDGYFHTGDIVEFEAPELHYFSYLAGIFDLVFWALPSPFADAFQQDVDIDIPQLMALLEHLEPAKDDL